MQLNGKRVVVTGPMSLDVRDFSVDPSALTGSEVLVRNSYSAISTGTELSIYTGTNPRVYEPNSWCNYPFQPGYAGLGRVLAAGPDVLDLQVGDAVFHHAHHSTFDTFDVRYSHHAKIPPEMLLPEVSLVRFGAIVLSGSVRLSHVEFGDRIALFGLGLIGQVAAQLFTLAGADVIGFDPVASRRRLAEHIGACVEIHDPSTEDAKEVVARVQAGGVDMLVDATGKSSVVMDYADLVRRRGQIVLLGTPFSSYTADVTSLLRKVHLNWLTVTGALEQDQLASPFEDVRHSYTSDVGHLLNLIRRGKLKVSELVSHVLPPGEFKTAYDGLLNHKDEYTAVVIDWTQS